MVSPQGFHTSAKCFVRRWAFHRYSLEVTPVYVRREFLARYTTFKYIQKYNHTAYQPQMTMDSMSMIIDIFRLIVQHFGGKFILSFLDISWYRALKYHRRMVQLCHDLLNNIATRPPRNCGGVLTCETRKTDPVTRKVKDINVYNLVTFFG